MWNEFCPMHEWVGPASYESGVTPVVTYLNEKWDRASSIHAIHFRQFAYVTTDFTGNVDNKIYYHCLVKVCERSKESVCSTIPLASGVDTSAANTCTPLTSQIPQRRRRSSSNDTTNQEAGEESLQLNASVGNPHVNECARYLEGSEGSVCIEERSSSSSATTCAATTGIAMFTYMLN